MIKNQPANTGDIRDVGSIPGLGRSLGAGNGNPLQYSCLGNPMVLFECLRLISVHFKISRLFLVCSPLLSSSLLSSLQPSAIASVI